MVSKEQYEKMKLSEDFELQIIRLYKNKKLSFNIDEKLFRKNLETSIFECQTGECIGEGWHGGMSSEEWKKRRQYYEQCLLELNG